MWPLRSSKILNHSGLGSGTFDRKVIGATQQLAKRQVTWMNKFKIDYRYRYPENNYHNLFDYIKKILN